VEILPRRRPPLSLVLDCSATLAFLLPDELSAPSQALLNRIVEHGALVPALWRLEVANALTMAVRRKRIAAPFRNAALRDLTQLGIRTDPDTDTNAWGNTLTLADRHGLTLYDSAYLELALRQDFPLATLDEALLRAAMVEGVGVCGD
jgi:predicted nucleic acid-binding protein